MKRRVILVGLNTLYTLYTYIYIYIYIGESEEEDYDGEEESDSEVEEILGKRKSKELPAHDEEHLLEGEDDEDEDDESIGDEGPLRKLRTGDDDSEEEKGEGLEVVSSEEEEVEVPKPAKPVQQGMLLDSPSS